MSTKKRWLWLLGLCLLLLGLTRAPASGMAGMALESWVMSGGESARASGQLALSATTGQAVAWRSSSGALTLYWGYWGPGNYEVYLPVVLREV
ncbi:MAG: hypothetical protein BWY63_02479 [Chloroflexi bacterium ADurb.Bin360]|nr:MAG: hypothetical protein BWY63_02479 [Chloroflexi bacterium ADurb.Bin360]